MTTTAAAQPSRSLLRLLGVLSAVIGLLAGLAASASASTASRSGSSSRLTHVVELETRVGVAVTPFRLFVGSDRSVSPGQVGKTCPDYDRIVSASCVATKPGGETAKPGRYTEADLDSTVDGLTEAEKQAVRNRQVGDKFDDKSWKSAKKKLDKTEKFNDERNAGKDRGQPNK